jgi:hypothetical protein
LLILEAKAGGPLYPRSLGELLKRYELDSFLDIRRRPITTQLQPQFKMGGINEKKNENIGKVGAEERNFEILNGEISIEEEDGDDDYGDVDITESRFGNATDSDPFMPLIVSPLVPDNANISSSKYDDHQLTSKGRSGSDKTRLSAIGVASSTHEVIDSSKNFVPSKMYLKSEYGRVMRSSNRISFLDGVVCAGEICELV